MDRVQALMAELERRGSEATRRTLLRHGAPASIFGVKVADLKEVMKAVPKAERHRTALGLFATGNGDAMYLAGLMADPALIAADELRDWAGRASWHMLREYSVAWVAAESRFGPELADEWVAAADWGLRSIGWATWSFVVALRPDDRLDLARLEALLDRVPADMPAAAERVKYVMNGFVISVGCYVLPLAARALATADALGAVAVDMGDTDCKVPSARAAIEKVAAMGKQGQKRKTVRC